jgi:hypothetical protein
MDSSSGRMARQWTNPLGQVDNQIVQKKAKRRASIYTLDTPNWSTTAAQAFITSSANFLLRSPRALNNQMSPLAAAPAPPTTPDIHMQKLDKRMGRECATFWHSSARAKSKAFSGVQAIK